MTQLTKKNSLQVVTSLSNLDLTKSHIGAVNISELINNLNKSQHNVNQTRDALNKARSEHEDGNFVGNWWHNREDDIKEAQYDLSSAVGELTSQSSKLIFFNTAISKILLDQQEELTKQQKKIESQTTLIKEQADKIEFQQEEISHTNQEIYNQQIEINKTNKGLLEAKNLTAEQAKKLIKIVDITDQIKNELLQSNSETLTSINILIKQHDLDIQETITNQKNSSENYLAELNKANADELQKKLEDINKTNTEQLQKTLDLGHETITSCHTDQINQLRIISEKIEKSFQLNRNEQQYLKTDVEKVITESNNLLSETNQQLADHNVLISQKEQLYILQINELQALINQEKKENNARLNFLELHLQESINTEKLKFNDKIKNIHIVNYLSIILITLSLFAIIYLGSHIL